MYYFFLLFSIFSRKPAARRSAIPAARSDQRYMSVIRGQYIFTICEMLFIIRISQPFTINHKLLRQPGETFFDSPYVFFKTSLLRKLHS